MNVATAVLGVAFVTSVAAGIGMSVDHTVTLTPMPIVSAPISEPTPGTLPMHPVSE